MPPAATTATAGAIAAATAAAASTSHQSQHSYNNHHHFNHHHRPPQPNPASLRHPSQRRLSQNLPGGAPGGEFLPPPRSATFHYNTSRSRHAPSPDPDTIAIGSQINYHQQPSSYSYTRPSRASSSFAARTSSLLPPPPRSVNVNINHSSHYQGHSQLPPSFETGDYREEDDDEIDNYGSGGVILHDFSNTSVLRPSTAQSHAASPPALAYTPASEGFRNLHRWSASTSSSRPPTRDHAGDVDIDETHSPDFFNGHIRRRSSIDTVSFGPPNNEPARYDPAPSPPRKLSKRRPSTANSHRSPRLGGHSPSQRRRTSPPPPAPAPPPSLPPIISILPFEANSEASASSPSLSTTLRSRANPSPSPLSSAFASNSRLGASRTTELWDAIVKPDTVASSNPAASTTTLYNPAIDTRDSTPVQSSSRSYQKGTDAMPGHTRSRSHAKGSSDSTKSKDKSKPSQKAMLSKALGKANTAVQLDNAQNYEAARAAYVEACDLLQHVLARTAGEEDRQKLEAIRGTYTSRIDELNGMLPMALGEENKELPARPDSEIHKQFHLPDPLENIDPLEDVKDSVLGPSPNITRGTSPHPPPTTALPPPPRPNPSPDGRKSKKPPPLDASRFEERPILQSSFSPMRRNFEGSTLQIPRPDGNSDMPAPLSPRRLPPQVPSEAAEPAPVVRQDFSMPSEGRPSRGHWRDPSHESVSWLDPIGESGGSSCGSSAAHSRSSSLGEIHRRHMRTASGDTEAQFDAALDAAVEAAYDDGYEPMDPAETTWENSRGSIDVVANAMRKVELAKERVRATEREAQIELSRERERQRQMSLGGDSATYGDDFYANSDEEEEAMLEEMTRDYVMNDYAFKPQPPLPPSTMPRESDSSGITTRTWHSSQGSNPPTGTTSLSPVKETPPAPLPKDSPPILPPPPQTLPDLPPDASSRPSSSTGTRGRRLSGANPKQLKIDTFKIGPPPPMPPPEVGSQAQKAPQSAVSSGPFQGFSLRAPPSPTRSGTPADVLGPSPGCVAPDEFIDEPRGDSPSSFRHGLRNNFSSSSLKSLKSRQLSISRGADDTFDLSPNGMTPLSQVNTNSSLSGQPAVPAMPPTPLATAFKEKPKFGGLFLFESDFHPPPSSPQGLYGKDLPTDPDIPLPLEPCPSDTMLRPFWLMRAIYQTLCHPRGGYITNRLFVPRDAWKVKGVKLRALEDKISQCDYLSAALLKLARVDSNDADAVLEEMQSLEAVLEQVQATLTRKLGNDVGTQGILALRDDKEGEPAPPVPRSSSVSGKSGAFSWRRLRNKNSAANLTSAYGGKSSSGGSTGSGPTGIEKEITSMGGSMSSLPMVAHPSSRPAKRDVSSVKFDGPYAYYTASLARLFDAAQTVDQIARQVDDPGLRHADKTQVGLELCTRHAAEFFSFYICRFVLTDLGMLLDKFVKRGSEWVMN